LTENDAAAQWLMVMLLLMIMTMMIYIHLYSPYNMVAQATQEQEYDK